MEFKCALEVWIFVIAFLARITSFARIVHTSLSPFFAASLRERLTLSSSRWIARIKIRLHKYKLRTLFMASRNHVFIYLYISSVIHTEYMLFILLGIFDGTWIQIPYNHGRSGYKMHSSIIA